jgi:hypothetical protein
MTSGESVLEALPAGDEQPLWQTDPDWRDNRIRSTARSEMWVHWLFAVAFVGFSIPLGFALPGEIDGGNHAAWVALLFPLVGLLMLMSAFARTRDWLRVGRLELSLDPFPGSLGGDVGGSVDLPIRYNIGRRFRVALACSRLYETDSGDSRSTSEKVLWDRNGIADTQPSITGTKVSFRFTPPADLPESEAKSDDYRRWAVRIRTDEDKPSFDRLFVIPVFATGAEQSRERIKDSHETLVDVPMPTLPARGMRMERTPYGVDLSFFAFRNSGIKLVFGIFGMACLVVSGFLGGFLIELGSDGVIVLFMTAIAGFMALVFGLIGLLLVVLFVWEIGNSFTARITRDEIAVSRRFFGIPIGRRRISTNALTSLDWKVGARSGRGAGSTKYQRLVAHSSTNKKLTIADGIRDPAVARHIEKTIASITRFQIKDK